MTGEDIKDIRLSIDNVAKDFERLAHDMKVLNDCLRPLQVDLMLKEDSDVESIT